ncbi:MAG TPA: peptide-methionine (S)-S-oxide reductase MsrA [Gemmatimonadaceae bacterium]|nr:peptide-methionine (S)-S-oxide reductase MsrA [Gemmatimonadaceae bacterium]
MSRRIGPASAALLIVLAVVLVLTRTSAGTARAAMQLAAPPSAAQLAAEKGSDTAYFAGGCFWGVEAVFEHMKGVESAVSGFSGGTVTSPSYEQVTTGTTGHAETVRVVYDPSQVSYGQLLLIFFAVVHDPTQLNRQGPDVGTHYRSAIFHTGDTQRNAATEYIAQLTAAKAFPRPIVTQIVPFDRFYVAEDYHQDFAERHPNHPYIRYHDAPKVAHLKQDFPEFYRERSD